MEFKDRLEMAITHKGYTLETLAEKSGVSVNTIINWKKGKNDPSFFLLSVLAEVLGVSLDWLAWGGSVTK